ncbi:ferric iron reductase FhuF-like transporter-domain-containing protein [Ilyonectria sp. MPI-CAGE-AT-0026]|nr:ferric iron reductase FhuF-like transporter-domain-containing protein [Ilyonectria sp. MPI-CAGE-AT-0026]
MTVLSKTDVAFFETTRRLLSHLVNEGLCLAFIEPTAKDPVQWLCLTSTQRDYGSTCMVKVHFIPERVVLGDAGQITSLVRPHQLRPRVLLDCDDQPLRLELDPGVIFQSVYPWFGEANEGSLILHKTLFTQAPLPQICPDEIWQMLSPEIVFLSVPRSQVRLSGPFEATLGDLLAKLGIAGCSADRVIVPSLAQQRPAIDSRFSDVQVVGSDRASAQASMRTVSLRPELQFKYHLKLSLACQITSALRTITPWTVLGGAEISRLLEKLLPPDMWVFREVAGVTGAQADFNDAKHLSCILREDLELRANLQNESLILASALSQRPVSGGGKSHAESLLPPEGKKEWFQKYVACLLNLTLVPLVNHGIGLEAHGQNICVRICRNTKAVKGFAVRDLGGIRLHLPTLRSQGFELRDIPPGAATTTDSLHDVWSKVHHSLFQNHIGHLIVALGLEEQGGWEIVRNQIKAILHPMDQLGSAHAAQLYEFLLAKTMPFKCFLSMRMEGKYRDYVERQLPNVLLY